MSRAERTPEHADREDVTPEMCAAAQLHLACDRHRPRGNFTCAWCAQNAIRAALEIGGFARTPESASGTAEPNWMSGRTKELLAHPGYPRMVEALGRSPRRGGYMVDRDTVKIIHAIIKELERISAASTPSPEGGT